MTTPTTQREADEFVRTLEGAAKEATDEWIAGFVRQHFGIYAATVDAQADTQQAGWFEGAEDCDGNPLAAIRDGELQAAVEFITKPGLSAFRIDGNMVSRESLVERIKHRATPTATTASASDEPAEYQYRTRPMWRAEGEGWTDWEKCSKESHADYARTPNHNDWQYEVRALYADRAPAQQTERMQPSRDAVLESVQRYSVGVERCTMDPDNYEGEWIKLSDAHAALAQQGAAQAAHAGASFEHQVHVMPPMRGTDSQQDAIVSTLPIDKIVQLMDENTDRHFGLKCEPFARAVEVETIRRFRAQGGITSDDNSEKCRAAMSSATDKKEQK